MIIPYGTRQIVQLDSFYVTDSPLSGNCRTGNVLVKLTSLNDYPLGDGAVS